MHVGDTRENNNSSKGLRNLNPATTSCSRQRRRGYSVVAMVRSNPKPGHPTGGAGRSGARRGGAARRSRAGRVAIRGQAKGGGARRNRGWAEPFAQGMTFRFDPQSAIRLGLLFGSTKNEILCKPNRGTRRAVQQRDLGC